MINGNPNTTEEIKAKEVMVDARYNEAKSKMEASFKKVQDLTYAVMIEPQPNGSQNFKLKSGGGHTIGLLKTPSIAVAKTMFEKYSVMESHIHAEKEILIVYSGSMTICHNNTKTKMNVGCVIEITPHMEHAAFTENEQCEFIAITIPSNINFPEDQR